MPSMSHKRSRNTFEADLHAPYAVFGTPLPDDAETRDDGSYVPIWKQEVRDERGQKRLHGAFTGGWSAGYFNTVGSKDGWTPSTFVSSRTNRHKDGAAPAQQRQDDYMDDEDRADAAEAQKLQTSQSFAGLGSSTQDELRAGGLMGLFRADGDTMGLKLLRRMGWRDGQGIGPKIRRSARLDVGAKAAAGNDNTYMFAPDNVQMVRFTRKTDRKGLDFQGEAKLTRREPSDDEEEDDAEGATSRGNISLLGPGRAKAKPERTGGIGVGILNDDGSGEDDPYEIGPRIKYNKVIGGDKKKKKKKAAAASNPALKNAPVFLPKTARGGDSLRRCHDGRLPLDGFVMARAIEDLTALFSNYAPPAVPPDWKSSKKRDAESNAASYISTADAAKASTHDPRSRAAILGEKALPGKSVFDFLSSAARDQMAAAAGRKDLPPARGELPEGSALSEADRQSALWDKMPKLDKETATAALSRSAGGPYADDEAKRARYRAYLENQADPGQAPPAKPKGMRDDGFVREAHEFYNCARIFKPMTGFMASRFTSAKITAGSQGGGGNAGGELLSRPEPKPTDPAEEAARMGMFGSMTRSVEDFHPSRLLCKRFNVKAPVHSRPDGEAEAGPKAPAADAWTPSEKSAQAAVATPTGQGAVAMRLAIEAPSAPPPEPSTQEIKAEVKPDENEAVEGTTAHAEVLKAIFGDSDSDSESIHPPSGHCQSPLPPPPPDRRAAAATSQNPLSSPAPESPSGAATRPPDICPLQGRNRQTVKLSATQEPRDGPPASREPSEAVEVVVHHGPPQQRKLPGRLREEEEDEGGGRDDDDDSGRSNSHRYPSKHRRLFVSDVHNRRRRRDDNDDDSAIVSDDGSDFHAQSPPPQYPASEAASSASSPRPPPFSSLYALSAAAAGESSGSKSTYAATGEVPLPGSAAHPAAAPAYTPLEQEPFDAESAFRDAVAETKSALPRDTKGESSSTARKDDDAEPPPAYSEGGSPLLSFIYVMAAAGGASSIITQVTQGGPPINAIGDVGADETIAMDLRGTRFVLSRDELLTLPEFVLLSLFPNGLFPEGHMNGYSEGDAVQVDYDPVSLQYMLDFFRLVAQTIPSETSPGISQDNEIVPLEPLGSRDDSSKRAGIIVLREDLDFYAIPPRSDISQADMLEVKRAAARALQQQDGIFSGLKRSDEPGTTEAHLIEMLTAGGFNHDDHWGHRAGEPNKAVVCSLALARLRSDIRGNDMGNAAVGMAQKLLLFWRKPARRCWWEGIELDDVEGLEGVRLKVWIRRVWTLEMSVIGLR